MNGSGTSSGEVQAVPEQDPRWPSGPWRGFWLQRAYPGRHEMTVDLRFANGKVEGNGQDAAGRFSVRGTYSPPEGRLDLVKRYVGGEGSDIRWDAWNYG